MVRDCGVFQRWPKTHFVLASFCFASVFCHFSFPLANSLASVVFVTCHLTNMVWQWYLSWGDHFSLLLFCNRQLILMKCTSPIRLALLCSFVGCELWRSQLRLSMFMTVFFFSAVPHHTSHSFPLIKNKRRQCCPKSRGWAVVRRKATQFSWVSSGGHLLVTEVLLLQALCQGDRFSWEHLPEPPEERLLRTTAFWLRLGRKQQEAGPALGRMQQEAGPLWAAGGEALGQEKGFGLDVCTRRGTRNADTCGPKTWASHQPHEQRQCTEGHSFTSSLRLCWALGGPGQQRGPHGVAEVRRRGLPTWGGGGTEAPPERGVVTPSGGGRRSLRRGAGRGAVRVWGAALRLQGWRGCS